MSHENSHMLSISCRGFYLLPASRTLHPFFLLRPIHLGPYTFHTLFAVRLIAMVNFASEMTAPKLARGIDYRPVYMVFDNILKLAAVSGNVLVVLVAAARLALAVGGTFASSHPISSHQDQQPAHPPNHLLGRIPVVGGPRPSIASLLAVAWAPDQAAAVPVRVETIQKRSGQPGGSE